MIIALVIVIVAICIERGWSKYQDRLYAERMADYLMAKSTSEVVSIEQLRRNTKRAKRRIGRPKSMLMGAAE